MTQNSFDNMPQSLALLHEKCDTIITLLTSIANGTTSGNSHVPIGMPEASRLLGKSPSTIYDMTSKRKIPFHKRGNKLYFFEDELMKWITGGGCCDADYPDYDCGNYNSNVDDVKAEEHLKQMQNGMKRKPKSLITGRETAHNL